MVRKYKVLKIDDYGQLRSPYRDFPYEIGKTYTCKNFDTDLNVECSAGFYATDVEGIIYAMRVGYRVFEVEMGGREIHIDQFKHRWETQTIIREIPECELRVLLKAEESKVGYKLEEACFPIHPFIDVKRKSQKPTKKEIALLNEWIKVTNSNSVSVLSSVESSMKRYGGGGDRLGYKVTDSIGYSIANSIRDSFTSSIWDSIASSIWGSMYGYISTLFPDVKEYKYISHEVGENPFVCGAELWRAGLVPSFDEIHNIWRLHAGKKAEIVYEIKV